MMFGGGGFQQQQPAFGQGTSGGFGSSSTFGQSGSLFSPSPQFGTSTTSTFAQPSMGGFGGTNPPSSFGASTSAFPSSSPTFGGGGGLFGGGSQQSAPSSFGGGSGLFGNPNPSGGGFGAFGNLSTPFSESKFPSSQMNQPFGSGSQFGMQEHHNPGNEVELKREERPSDTITSVRFGPNNIQAQNLVCISSWDASLRLFQYFPNQYPVFKSSVNMNVPILDSCFKSDAFVVFTAGADGTVSSWNCETNQQAPIGRHDATVKTINWIPNMNLLVSGGWDSKLRYWDLRQPNPVEIVSLSNRIHATAVRTNYLVTACGGMNFPVYLFDIRNPRNFVRDRVTAPAIKLAVRAVAISTDSSFYACTGIEGRVHLNFIDDLKRSQSFAFRAHKTEVGNRSFYNAINDIQFHPQSNYFATCGSDGTYCFWDHASKRKLLQGPISAIPSGGVNVRPFQPCMFPGNERPAPILTSNFNFDGSVYAYALGYDWSGGAAVNQPQNQVNTVVFHTVTSNDFVAKTKKNEKGSWFSD